MGQKHGKEATTIACVATSHCVKFSEVELKLMWGKIMGNLPDLSIADFHAAVSSASVRESDQEILEKIFVLCDDTGDEVVNAQKFMAAASVLVAAEAEQKFAIAFSFYDFANSGKISGDDALSAVAAMNCCAEWFGDVAMEQPEMEALVESSFEGRSSMELVDAAAKISNHSVFGAYLDRAIAPKPKKEEQTKKAEPKEEEIAEKVEGEPAATQEENATPTE